MDYDVLAERRAPYDLGLGTLQTLMEGLSTTTSTMRDLDLPVPTHGRGFVEFLEHI